MQCVSGELARWVSDQERAWGISCDLAWKLGILREQYELESGRRLEIISGYRTCGDQERLEAAGRPAAPCHLSTHTTSPATGADVSIGFGPTTAMKARLGALAVWNELRWGGGSPVDPQTGIPSDWNHFDLGPRGS
jgi:hypothetical protein